MTNFKRGDIVLYRSFLDSPQFGAVIASDPSPGRYGSLRCNLAGLGKFYFDFFGQSECQGLHLLALVANLELAPTIFCTDRQWRTEQQFQGCDDAILVGQVYWSNEDVFEEIGWRFIAQEPNGMIIEAGPADSYETARAKVEELCK